MTDANDTEREAGEQPSDLRLALSLLTMGQVLTLGAGVVIAALPWAAAAYGVASVVKSAVRRRRARRTPSERPSPERRRREREVERRVPTPAAATS